MKKRILAIVLVILLLLSVAIAYADFGFFPTSPEVKNVDYELKDGNHQIKCTGEEGEVSQIPYQTSSTGDIKNLECKAGSVFTLGPDGEFLHGEAKGLKAEGLKLNGKEISSDKPLNIKKKEPLTKAENEDAELSITEDTEITIKDPKTGKEQKLPLQADSKLVLKPDGSVKSLKGSLSAESNKYASDYVLDLGDAKIEGNVAGAEIDYTQGKKSTLSVPGENTGHWELTSGKNKVASTDATGPGKVRMELSGDRETINLLGESDLNKIDITIGDKKFTDVSFGGLDENTISFSSKGIEAKKFDFNMPDGVHAVQDTAGKEVLNIDGNTLKYKNTKNLKFSTTDAAGNNIAFEPKGTATNYQLGNDLSQKNSMKFGSDGILYTSSKGSYTFGDKSMPISHKPGKTALTKIGPPHPVHGPSISTYSGTTVTAVGSQPIELRPSGTIHTPVGATAHASAREGLDLDVSKAPESVILEPKIMPIEDAMDSFARTGFAPDGYVRYIDDRGREAIKPINDELAAILSDTGTDLTPEELSRLEELSLLPELESEVPVVTATKMTPEKRAEIAAKLEAEGAPPLPTVPPESTVFEGTRGTILGSAPVDPEEGADLLRSATSPTQAKAQRDGTLSRANQLNEVSTSSEYSNLVKSMDSLTNSVNTAVAGLSTKEEKKNYLNKVIVALQGYSMLNECAENADEETRAECEEQKAKWEELATGLGLLQQWKAS